MQSFPPRSVSEAPHSTSFAASSYANPFMTAPSHATQYAPMVAGMGASSFGPTAPSMLASASAAGGGPAGLAGAAGLAGPLGASGNSGGLLPRSLTDRAAGGFDGLQPPSLLGRSASHAMGPFQFKFEPSPASLAVVQSESTGVSNGTEIGGPEQPKGPFHTAAGEVQGPYGAGGEACGSSGAAPWDVPQPAAQQQQQPQPQPPPQPVAVQLPAAKGREGVLSRQSNPTFGISQEPLGCSLQLDECVARCRQEVQALAAECQRRGAKYSDPDFPPDDRALYRSGRAPSISSASEQPISWRRASEGALTAVPVSPSAAGQAPLGAGEVLLPGRFGTAPLLAALAAVRSLGKDPRELVVWKEPEAGIYGVRIFKDGEWMYEVLDDLLPLTASGQPACSYAMAAGGEASEWLALVEKAYAKVHGCYEAVARATQEEALEDVSGAAASRVALGNFAIWGELWRHLRTRRRRGFLQVAMRRVEAPGEVLTSGLVSGYGYPVTRLEMVEGQMLCELQNPWPIGAWCGPWGAGSPEAYRLGPLAYNADSNRSFWMSIQEFVKNFTDVFDARLVPSSWQSSVLTFSSERSTSALITVSSKTQAIFELTQSDRRWSDHEEEYANAIGLRIYRCRIVAPPQNAVGLRQNVSNPFSNLELVAERPLAKVHSAVIELPHLEPGCLYIAAMEAQHAFAWASLRLLTVSAPRGVRELSPPETSYFLDAQAMACPAIDNDSFSSQGSVDLLAGAPGAPQGLAPGPALPRQDPMKRNVDGADGWDWQEGEAIKLPNFLQACMASCSGEC